MRSTITSWLPSLRGSLLGLAALGLSAGAAQAQTVYGLSITSTPAVVSLVTFSAATPGTFTATVPITGFTAGQAIVGIDVRPNTGELFALGYNPTGTQAQLYTIDRTTGIVTPIGAALTLNLGTTTSRIGFDFNPTVDRIRVVSGIGTDFRLNPNNGALAATDGALAYAAADANAGQTPGVGSAAYTNSYIGSTATRLYDLDEANSRLVTQDPPNAGTLNTVGPLGVATNGASQASDLDIYFNPATSANVAYMTTAISTNATAATSTLYTVNLTTGAATSVGALGTGPLVAITDITFAIDRPATLPALTGQLAYGLAGGNLISFDTSTPGAIRTSVAITGVDATQTLVGLDVRPLNNALYVLGYNGTAQTGQLYGINPTTGAAVAVGGVLALELGTGDVSFDFNPTVDRIRVVGANRNNYRINPITGTVAFTDGQVAYTTGTNTPTIGAVAYTNSFMGANATSGTTLYNYDQVLNVLNTQSTANPPADGQLTTVGPSGITVNTTAPNVDMDIFSTGAGINMAYLVANTGTSLNSAFYTLNLTTGAATLVGTIGNGLTVRDVAIAGPAGVVAGTRQRNELATGLTLFPNPVSSDATLAFTLPRSGQVSLTVTDALGRTVEQRQTGPLGAGAQTLRWSSASQKAGMYFLSLQLDGQPAGTQRVLVR
ncbi:Por secretion system C-terminal sorting domain-containing protein [Hymenobacter gelipurpurascens]|uniref:Por secretion system C-terminal sorting domain-containing protein n=1 Tax=Hymenobacter gelipurpurascens TaxID=89968 RepID=A0A212U971_9BACT|nr:DUF4394 domain-containing protein [Hymenobacter gelipurpurascens]SNC74766.1 Por secretion system C-terminal sorting domain-containing protein [Hymenobacter gelipurpurascens]